MGNQLYYQLMSLYGAYLIVAVIAFEVLMLGMFIRLCTQRTTSVRRFWMGIAGIVSAVLLLPALWMVAMVGWAFVTGLMWI